MSTNETSTLKLDLDAKKFTDDAEKAYGIISKLGNSENLSGLTRSLMGALGPIGLIITAVLAMKKAFEEVFDAEKIEKINNQFDILAKNAGVAGERLKEDLVKSVNGLADDTDVIESANKALVSLGSNADKLPQIMELARKATSVMGGDLIQNFELINNAVASGNTKMLRQIGIIIDSDKAMREYAGSIGKFKSDLTDAEKKQAILNATLEKGGKVFKGVKEDNESLTVTWQKLKVAVNDLSEAVTKAFNRMFGPLIRSAVKSLSTEFKLLASQIKESIGDESEKASAKMDRLQISLKKAQENLDRLNEKKKENPILSPADAELFNRLTSDYTNNIKKISAEIDNLKKTAKIEPKDDESPESKEPKEKNTASQSKFYDDILKLKEKNIQDQIEMDTDYDEMENRRSEQIFTMHEELAARIKVIDDQARQEGGAAEADAVRLKEEVYNEYANKIKNLSKEIEEDRISAAKNAANAEKDSFRGFALGAKAASIEASKDLGNFSVLGKQSFDSFRKNAANAFIAIGDGSKSAGDAMKGFMLNSLADIAQAQGELLLASALLNPLNAVAGAALLTLSGVLRSLAGTAQGASGLSGGGYAGSSGEIQSSASQPPAVLTPSEPKKKVTINIQGHYFNTLQTQKALMDMIREETDNTGYSYVQINPGTGS